ncbi:MAG: hypothetical protein R3F24_01555 [Gammaproteobacteria bacterium]
MKSSKRAANAPPAARKRRKASTAAGRKLPRTYEGGCHCGAIEYSYTTALPASRWSVHLCQCKFCRGHGARSTADPAGELQFRFERPEFLRRYRFALRTTDFVVCKECGTYVAAVLLSGRGAHGLLNVNTLHAPPRGMPAGKAVTHDGESGELRRARRGQAWTPVVGPV